jgi:hypothetical protein
VGELQLAVVTLHHMNLDSRLQMKLALLSTNSEIKLEIRHYAVRVLYGCETWSPISSEEHHKLRLF